ncbi:MAG: YfhO family protein, partial [Clostridia bacterium]|nr:YfhO family protein [Clostridia bacterium]
MNQLQDPGAHTRRRGTLLLCFAVPALAMTLLYAMIEVFPFGKNSVLVLDLNAQYIYYFEQFREIVRSGESILYSFKRAL